MPLPEWALGVHHDGSESYLSNPLPKHGETVTISLRVPSDAPIQVVICRVIFDGEFSHKVMRPNHSSGDTHLYSLDYLIEEPRTTYSFKIIADDGAYYYNAFGISRADSPSYYEFAILANYQAPLWVRDCVFYQIFPDRFHNGDPSNDVQDGLWEREGAKTRLLKWGESPIPWIKGRSVDFFGGDIQGITQKLDHLTRLGFNAIYLTPVWKAASNHHYDASSFNEVDEHLGGNESLAELRRESLKHNIKLMLDITPNHIGVTHDWFVAAKRDHKGPTASYFFYNEEKQFFETWLGVASLIKLNYASEKLRDEMYRSPESALRRWIKAPYQIDGWRLDVANMTGNLKMSQLDHEVWREMRPIIKADDQQFYLLGEYFQDGTPHTQGEELDAAMNYQGFNTPVRRWLAGEDLGVADSNPWGDIRPMDTDAMVLQLRRFIAAVPYPIALQQYNQLDSHDTTRLLYITKGDVALAKLGLALLMAYTGVPCVYYGTEIGMAGGKDPDNRRCMEWDESQWDMDLFTYHQTIIAIRKGNHALKHGGLQFLLAEGDTVAFLRESRQQRIVVVGYRGDDNETITLPVKHGGISDGATLKDLLSGQVFTVKNGAITLKAHHGQAWLLNVQ